MLRASVDRGSQVPASAASNNSKAVARKLCDASDNANAIDSSASAIEKPGVPMAAVSMLIERER